MNRNKLTNSNLGGGKSYLTRDKVRKTSKRCSFGHPIDVFSMRGFTLIELLAVIIILAVIALIATPVVLNVVDNAKKSANLQTVNGIIDAGRLYYAESMLDESKKGKIENIIDIYPDVAVSNKPSNAKLYVNENGLIATSVVLDKTCYIKKFNTGVEVNDSNCDLGNISKDNIIPTIEFSYSEEKGNNEWYKGNAYIKAKVIDNESGPSRLKWCMTDSEECEPTTEINQIQVSPIINTDTIGKRICVIGYDVFGNESEKACSNLVKVDKTAPEINGVENIIINKGDSLDLRSGITTTDNLSGIEGKFIVTPSSIDTSTVGTATVEYKVKDQAGNETIKTRTIEVLGEAPSITFSSTGTFNSNGWAKTDFYIRTTITDNSNKGIKSSKWCITQGESCQPNTEASVISALVSTESGNNKICVEAIDNNDKITTSCSNVYKLDKTKPQFSGINDITIQKNASIDLRSGVTVSDITSGVDGTFTVNPTSIDTSKAGTTNVTYTISDLAGNTQTITRKIIVDTASPTATFTVQGSPINSNGWSKSDFYVKVDINDQSGLGIKEAKWCSTQSNTCTPNVIMSGTSMTPLISTQSNNNRICIQATDNNNKTSEVVCSDAYKLDKTLPTAGTATFSGIIGSNSWYTSNVTVNTSNGSDSLSGHSSTTTNVSSITSNTSGTIITITTTDLAGNQSTRTYTIKVDKNTPTLTAKSQNFEVSNNWSETSFYFNNPSYSISGGSMSCSPTNTSSMAVGNQTITCTATGGNGLKTIATKMLSVNAGTIAYYPSDSCVFPESICGTEDISAGVRIDVMVNSNDMYGFYVLEDDGTYLTLLMDTQLVLYHDTWGNGIEGPVDVIERMKEATSSWTNIIPHSYTIYGNKATFDEYVIENIRAELPSYDQMYNIGCRYDQKNSCPTWAALNLSNIDSGYWLSSIYEDYGAYIINLSRQLSNRPFYDRSGEAGIRPVIKIAKNQVEVRG